VTRRSSTKMAYFGGMTLTWLGHATLHIQTAGGTSILVDPWFEGNPSSPKGYKLPEKVDRRTFADSRS
jgi:L-ascorbate metabolism protein UlaG (beta-lactamase superfamily)